MIFSIIELRVADFMSSNLVKARESERLINAIDLMAEKKIGNLIIEKKESRQAFLQ